MKFCLITSLILLLSTSIYAQQSFAFNDAMQEHQDPVAKLTSHTTMPSVKALLNTGPYAVNHDLVNQKLDIAMANVFDVLDYELQDMNGRHVTAPTIKDGFKIKVLLDRLPRGLYLLKLRSAQETFTTKIQHGI